MLCKCYNGVQMFTFAIADILVAHIDKQPFTLFKRDKEKANEEQKGLNTYSMYKHQGLHGKDYIRHLGHILANGPQAQA